MPISTKFSVSADGRLQMLPSMALSNPPSSSPGGTSVLEEHGALQGVAAIAGDDREAKQKHSVFEDALLVSRANRESSRKLQSLSDESDLAAGRSQNMLEADKAVMRKHPIFDAYTNAAETEESGTSARNISPPSGWQPHRRTAPAAGLRTNCSTLTSAALGLALKPETASGFPRGATAITSRIALPAWTPGLATLDAKPMAVPSKRDALGSGAESLHTTCQDRVADLTTVAGGLFGGGASLATSARSLPGGSMPAAGVPLMLTSGVQVAPASGAKHSSRVSDSESREKQLLAQIKELTRQLDKEKNRKKEQARASHASKEQRRRLVICSQLLPYRMNQRDDGTLKVGGASSKLKAYDSLHQRLDVAWVGCPAMHVPAQQQEAVRRQFLKVNCHPVFITESEMELAEGMWAEVLWPLFHYIPVRCAGCVGLTRHTVLAPSAGSHRKSHSCLFHSSQCSSPTRR